ncbi:SDR family NAD(P)-dependent oxidoreductase [Nonomuraea polychroma]|uniref:SDR family NAD(P)-dependent oxidoreductase n=1 Tax=Nonomuraea polychroma TaxID=46176 RepID=UPI003D924382
MALDITDSTSVAAAARATGDVTVLIDNAGSSAGTDLLAGDLDNIRLEMDTHYFGTLSVVRGFAPQIAANGGGAILNIQSSSTSPPGRARRRSSLGPGAGRREVGSSSRSPWL